MWNWSCNFVKFDIHFLWFSQEIFFGVITDDLLNLSVLKNVKKNAISFKLFWYKIFVHWKLKKTQFHGGSHLSILYAVKNLRKLRLTHANNITLIAKKSNNVIFRPYKKKVHNDNETNKSVNSLERKDCIKYLGVLIDENLSWRKHIVTVGR